MSNNRQRRIVCDASGAVLPQDAVYITQNKHNKITIHCDQCGKEMHRWQSQLKNTNFCSQSCRGESLKGKEPPNKNQKEVECSVCGKIKKVSPSRVKDGKAYLCSEKCETAWRKERFKKENHPGWKSGGKKVVCDICGKEFLTPRPNAKRTYCSRKCSAEAGKTTNISVQRTGRNKEREAKNILKANGYYVMKSAGSLGIFDLIAFNEQEIKLIQVKSTRGRAYYTKDITAMRSVDCPENAVKELWVWHVGKEWEIINVE